jgi:hypothetical protein
MAVNLSCGSWGDNSISVNVTLHHLLNIKTVADRRENMLWFRIPPKTYFKSGCLPVALRDLAGKKRAAAFGIKGNYGGNSNFFGNGFGSHAFCSCYG